jgi:hypothetical protein
MPEPADSAAYLYLQDAFRSDLVRSAAFRSTLGGVFVCTLVSWAMIWQNVAWCVPLLLGVLMMIWLFLETPDFRNDPAGYMRSRLWPTLTPGQVLRSGDPLPTRAAS